MFGSSESRLEYLAVRCIFILEGLHTTRCTSQQTWIKWCTNAQCNELCEKGITIFCATFLNHGPCKARVRFHPLPRTNRLHCRTTALLSYTLVLLQFIIFATAFLDFVQHLQILFVLVVWNFMLAFFPRFGHSTEVKVRLNAPLSGKSASDWNDVIIDSCRQAFANEPPLPPLLVQHRQLATSPQLPWVPRYHAWPCPFALLYWPPEKCLLHRLDNVGRYPISKFSFSGH